MDKIDYAAMFTIVGCDGACSLQVRKGGWACFDGEKISSGSLIDCTNNQAEYQGLISLLEILHKKDKPVKPYMILMDSELVVNQILGSYRVKSAELRPFYLKAMSLYASIGAHIRWVPREHELLSELDFHAKRAKNL